MTTAPASSASSAGADLLTPDVPPLRGTTRRTRADASSRQIQAGQAGRGEGEGPRGTAARRTQRPTAPRGGVRPGPLRKGRAPRPSGGCRGRRRQWLRWHLASARSPSLSPEGCAWSSRGVGRPTGGRVPAADSCGGLPQRSSPPGAHGSAGAPRVLASLRLEDPDLAQNEDQQHRARQARPRTAGCRRSAPCPATRRSRSPASSPPRPPPRWRSGPSGRWSS